MKQDKLLKLLQKPQKLAIGLMSGTSMNGLDVAVCKVKLKAKKADIEVLHFDIFPFELNFYNQLKQIAFQPNAPMQQVAWLHKHIAAQHAAIVLQALAQWQLKPEDIDVIGSHGQTVFHHPFSVHDNSSVGNVTMQLGDGDVLAAQTGIVTVSDFRQKHIAYGLEGAPLVPYLEALWKSRVMNDTFLVNIGGIANITFLSPQKEVPLIYTDTGPGNTLLDTFTKILFNKSFDEDGLIAAKGTVVDGLLNELTKHSFFSKPIPKSTGQELFNEHFVLTALQQVPYKINPFDALATLTAFTAKTIATTIQQIAARGDVYINGGGVKNKALLQYLKLYLPNYTIYDGNNFSYTTTIHAANKEAVLFAYLGAKAVSPFHKIPKHSGLPNLHMGKISLP